MKRLTESDCQRVLVVAAKRGGWLVHHSRPSLNVSGKWSTAVQGHVGFCDLVLAHPVRGLVFAELKRKPGKLTAMQLRWIGVLNEGPTVSALGDVAQVWWMPEELEERVKWLMEEPA